MYGIKLRLSVGRHDTIILTLSDNAPFVGTLVSLGARGDTDLHFAAHLAMCIDV
jgi:hypothetical protein